MPGRSRRSMIHGERLGGPMVHTILECRKAMVRTTHRQNATAFPALQNYLATANSETIRASASTPLLNDAIEMRSSSPCMRFKSSSVTGNGHKPYACTLCKRNFAESVAHVD